MNSDVRDAAVALLVQHGVTNSKEAEEWVTGWQAEGESDLLGRALEEIDEAERSQ